MWQERGHQEQKLLPYLLTTKLQIIFQQENIVQAVNILCVINSKLNSTDISNYFTKTEINDKIINYIYQ